MSHQEHRRGGNIVPCLRYENAPDAIEWLCEVFGFRENLVIYGEADEIVHSQLVLGNGMVMVGSAGTHGSPLEDVWQPLTDPDSLRPQIIHVVVDEIDAHYERSVEGGCEIILENEEQDYGGRGYSCRDLEGNIWSFGSYDPWAEGEEA